MTEHTITIELTPEEHELFERLGDELDLSMADVVRRGLAILAKQGDDEIEAEQRAKVMAADLIERLRAAGITIDDRAVMVERRTIDAVTVTHGDSTYWAVGDKLIGTRRLDDGQAEQFEVNE